MESNTSARFARSTTNPSTSCAGRSRSSASRPTPTDRILKVARTIADLAHHRPTFIRSISRRRYSIGVWIGICGCEGGDGIGNRSSPKHGGYRQVEEFSSAELVYDCHCAVLRQAYWTGAAGLTTDGASCSFRRAEFAEEVRHLGSRRRWNSADECSPCQPGRITVDYEDF